MPKQGMEPIRRKALIDAAIQEIGSTGSLDVTVGQIARKAGMSPALAHHYFGSKDRILLAAMRHILTKFGDHVRYELALATTPQERLEAIFKASFHPHNFRPEVIATWLLFYVQAQKSPEAKRLLRIYSGRLSANLLYDLRRLTHRAHAEEIAQGLASMIDGFYIRHALQDRVPDRLETLALVTEYLHLKLGQHPRKGKPQ